MLQMLVNRSNNPRKYLCSQPFAFLICLLIIGSWIVSARYYDLSLIETQNSNLLLNVGAINGESLLRGEYWKLISSQFLHVKFLHMLLNVAFIYYIGSKIEKDFGSIVFYAIYLISGSFGQLASVFSYPNYVSSGASQALCGLAGAFLILFLFPLKASKTTLIWVIIFIFIQTFLDLFVAGEIKSGHSVGFIIGVLFGLLIRKTKAFRSQNSKYGKHVIQK